MADNLEPVTGLLEVPQTSNLDSGIPSRAISPVPTKAEVVATTFSIFSTDINPFVNYYVYDCNHSVSDNIEQIRGLIGSVANTDQFKSFHNIPDAQRTILNVCKSVTNILDNVQACVDDNKLNSVLVGAMDQVRNIVEPFETDIGDVMKRDGVGPEFLDFFIKLITDFL